MYRSIYELRFKLDKKHRFGIHTTLEEKVLEYFETILSATLKQDKSELLNRGRLLLEIIQHLIRLEYELKILSDKKYLSLSVCVTELTKMTTGWYNHSMKK